MNRYFLVIDADEMGFFCSLNEVRFHFNDFIQLKLAGWDIEIWGSDGWGYYEIEITDEYVKIGDLTIYEEADLRLNGVGFKFFKE